jgi:hypothetical protein
MTYLPHIHIHSVSCDIKNSASGTWFYTPHLAYDSMYHGSQTGSQFLPQASNPTCTRDLFPWVKAAGTWSWSFTFFFCSETKNSSTHNTQDVLWCLPRQRNSVTYFMHAGITGMSHVWKTPQNLCVWKPADGTIIVNTWKWQDTVTQRCSSGYCHCQASHYTCRLYNHLTSC